MKSKLRFGRSRALACTMGFMATTALAKGYVAQGSCGGFARVDITSPPGTCVALLADEVQGLRMPRGIVEVAPGRFWITDMGSWGPRRGRLLELVLPTAPMSGGTTRRASVNVLANGLDRPHGLAVGPDNKIYVGEAGSIWRSTRPSAGRSLQRETVIDKLPDDGAHPLKAIAFGPDKVMYLNMGSSTDACRNEQQLQPYPCPELAGPKPRAAVYAVRLEGPMLTPRDPEPFATGLRNSLALAVLRDGTVLQGENSIDYTEAGQPPEELNVLRRGSHHGWPYCVGDRQAARGYEKRHDCKRSAAPLQIWPAHTAPLAMLVAPDSSPWPKQLLVTWHGYSAEGHRVMRIALDAKGHPTGQPIPVLHGWESKPGVRPLGKPAGLAFDRKGRLLVVEDLNSSVLMLLPIAP